MSEYVATASPDADPTAVPSLKLGRLLVALFPASTMLYALFNGIQSILLPAQVQAIDPVNKVGNLAVIAVVVALVAMAGVPAGGALSDRTRSRFGRRAPWLAVSSVIAGALAIALQFPTNLVVLTVVMGALVLVANFYAGALIAVMPDRIPVARRGLASAVIGITTPIGILVGVNVASHSTQSASYTFIGIGLVVATAIFLFGAREQSSLTLPEVEKRPKAGFAAETAAFFHAFRARDFTLAFASRFGLFLAYFTVSGYGFYIFQDYIGAKNLPGGDVANAVSTALSITIVGWIIVASIVGPLADKLDRRKLFVGISAIGLAVSLIIPLIWPTWTGMLVYSFFVGASIGTYFAVDLAIMSMVLPNNTSAGRDFGLLNAATGLPTVLSPAIAGLLISFLGGYPALFIFGALCALTSGFLMLCIKSVR